MSRFFIFLARKQIGFQHSIRSNSVYFAPQRGDAAFDFAKISGDMKMIGRDLKYSINRESSHNGQ